MLPSSSAFSLRQFPKRVFYGWWIVAIGAVITCIVSLYTYGFTVFFLPLSRELGLSRTATSVIFSTTRLEGSIEGPIVGWLTDRVGPRTMLIWGAVLAGTGFLVLTMMHSFWGVLIIYTGLIALGVNMGFFQAMVVAANSWFIRHRTVAISIIAASFRLGAAGLTPLLAVVVLRYGWRTGALATGLLMLGVVIPLALLVRRSPESMGLLPDGAHPAEAKAVPDNGFAVSRRPSVIPHDYTVGEAIKSPAYWLMATANGLRMGAFSGTIVHLVPIFVWRGTSEQVGANLVGTAALVGLPLTLVLGWFADRSNKPAIMAMGTASNALAMMALAWLPGWWVAYLFVGLFALGESVGPVTWSLLGEFFGRKHFATLRGVITAFGILGAVMPIFLGKVYDATESYRLGLMTLSVLSALSAALYVALLVLRRRQLARANAAAP